MDNNSLYHYGIPGQKWGVRRYQNPDGTYTSAGLKRRAELEAEQEVLKKSDNTSQKIRTNEPSKNVKPKKEISTKYTDMFLDNVKTSVTRKIADSVSGLLNSLIDKALSKTGFKKESDAEKIEKIRNDASNMTLEDLEKETSRYQKENMYVSALTQKLGINKGK